jgi:hypothetical protein
MNIVEAAKAAQERGFSVIARDYLGGFELLRVTNGKEHTHRVNYPDGATGSALFKNYSLSLKEILSENWYVPDFAQPDYDVDFFDDNNGIEFEPVEFDTGIKELHGYRPGDFIELVPTGDMAYILGFNPKMTCFDIAVSFCSCPRPDGYVSAEDIKLLLPTDDTPDEEPEPVPEPPAPLISKQNADMLIELARGKVNNGFFEPYTSERFKETVRFATDTELSIAEIYLVDARDRGGKVKRRLQAVSRERYRRAKGKQPDTRRVGGDSNAGSKDVQERRQLARHNP